MFRLQLTPEPKKKDQFTPRQFAMQREQLPSWFTPPHEQAHAQPLFPTSLPWEGSSSPSQCRQSPEPIHSPVSQLI